MGSPANTLVKQNKVGATDMDKTLADYINRTMERIKKEDSPHTPIPEPESNPNDYKVYPEVKGDEDHKRNPYSSV